MATISVIIPAYNAECTILETIASVQEQTFSDFEVIVINDGSTDRTLERLTTVKDSRLKIFSYENGGVSVARNHGIAHATGEFISFIDADDLWTPDKLELQLAALQKHPEAGVAYSWTSNMSDEKKSFDIGHSPIFIGNVYPELLVTNFIANGSNLLIRRQAIESVGEFDPALSGCADWDFYVRLAARWLFVVVPKPQILYRQSSGSMSSKIETMEKENIFVIEKIFQRAPPELQSLKKQSLAMMYQYLAGICLARVNNLSEVKQASQKLQMAVRLYPQIWLDRLTQRYVIKCLLMQLVTPKLAKSFTRPVSKARNIADPRLKP
jgi:glycosyltransferase involved in cell wall biosynthesis